MTAREWDGGTYDRISAPIERVGLPVLARLVLRGDETVLDAGCGSGRVTEALLERLPDGRVVAVDGSQGMLDAARARLGEDPRVEYVHSDLLALDLGGRTVDAVFSTATFHWVPDHPALFARLRALLRPEGRLVAQCGGAGNCAELTDAIAAIVPGSPFEPHLGGWPGPWEFAAPDTTAIRLAAAGFTDIETELIQADPPYEGDPREWLATNSLGAHLERLPEALRDPFVDAVTERVRETGVSYIRLNLSATAA